MKKQICSVCERKYWAQVVAYGPSIIHKVGDRAIRKTKPKTERCKKHALKTRTYPKSAKHHFNKDIKRRVNRRSGMGLAPKKRREKGNVSRGQ